MLLSRIKQTSAIAWSPVSTHTSHMALGTLHSTLTPPKLSIQNTSSEEIKVVAEVDVNEKFVCLDWGNAPIGGDLGVLAGGMDDSSIQLFDVEKMYVLEIWKHSNCQRIKLS